MPPKEVFFITGEPSADLHASMLATELLRRGDYRLTGAGGPLMRQAGVQTDVDSSDWATMGLVQTLRRIPAALLARGPLLKLLEQRRPDLLVLVDFGGFNMNIARHVRRFSWHLPILYYFPPKSWDKRERDRSDLVKLADAVATPFPWSERLLRADGVNAHFVGHPVMDRIQPVEDQARLRQDLGLPAAERYVGLMPGSRRIERALMGPQLLGAARRLVADGGYHFLWSPGPPGFVDRLRIPTSLAPHVTIVERSVDLLHAADVTVMSFGTTTLEATAALAPLIGVYRGTLVETATYALMKLPTKYYALPNIILGYGALPELVRRGSDAAPLAECIRGLFARPQALAEARAALARAREQLGTPGSIQRTADLVESTLAGRGGAA